MQYKLSVQEHENMVYLYVFGDAINVLAVLWDHQIDNFIHQMIYAGIESLTRYDLLLCKSSFTVLNLVRGCSDLSVARALLRARGFLNRVDPVG